LFSLTYLCHQAYLLGPLECTISFVRWIAAVSTQPYDFVGLTITSWLYGQLVSQSFDILWLGTKSLLWPNSMPGDAFQMVKTFFAKDDIPLFQKCGSLD
jgi:hypothetical protein